MPKGSKLTFFGGVNEIGGNKILLEDRGTRILLDFGKSFKSRSAYYDWNEGPRLSNGIGDLLSLGILPDLKGIYREDLLSLAGRQGKEDKLADAVFLTHAHADHADYISFLREDIGLYMGETTKKIIESLEYEKGSRLEFEITSYKRRPSDRSADKIARKVTTFSTSSARTKPIQVDSVDFEPVHVDHSIPGCYGFIIRTSDKTYVYTGDIRVHGNKPQLTRDFVEAARESKPDALICEGTRISDTAVVTEKSVFDICNYFVASAKEHLVYADYSYKDTDRFTTFYNIAKSTGRKLVIHARVARYLASLRSGDNPLDLPSLNDENLLIYKPRGKSGAYEDNDYQKDDLNLFVENKDNVWTAIEVRKNPSKIILALGPYQIDELLDIAPKDGLYLHSTSEPFNEEGELSEEKMQNWLERFGLEKIHAHCSGHASGMDLNKIVTTINPKILVPVHTEHAALFSLLHGTKVKVPEPCIELTV